MNEKTNLSSNKKYSLLDFTFLIPVRIESIVRLENLIVSVNYILKHFDTNIIILHASDYENGLVKKNINKNIKYEFVEDRDPVFYRTKYINQMTLESKTPLIGIWDADVIIHYKQIIDAVEKLREGYEIAYPYNGDFYDTSDIIREQFWKRQDIKLLIRHQAKMKMIYGKQLKGGAVFVNKEAYLKAGLENEKFYGWSPEDSERYDRFKTFGYKIYRSSGSLFHLTHSRGSNSTYRTSKHAAKTHQLLDIVRMSSPEDLGFDVE
jgi:hypothetical protein